MDDHAIERRMYYHDTDPAGVVYYANYLVYMEEARTEYFLSKGIDLRETAAQGTLFVVARVEISYRAPARYLDTIRISTGREGSRPSVIRLSQIITRQGSVLAHATTDIVCVTTGMRPKIIPARVRHALGIHQ